MVVVLSSASYLLPPINSSPPPSPSSSPFPSPVVRDPNPQWRSVCWSSQDTWLAVGNRLVMSSTLRHACTRTKLTLLPPPVTFTHPHAHHLSNSRHSLPLSLLSQCPHSHPHYSHNALTFTLTTPTIPSLVPSLLPQYPHSTLTTLTIPSLVPSIVPSLLPQYPFPSSLLPCLPQQW